MYLLESGRGGAGKSSFRIGAESGAKVKLRSGRDGEQKRDSARGEWGQ